MDCNDGRQRASGAGLQNVGYLYNGYSSPPVFAGVLNLSLSGTFESLSNEPEPSNVGYINPDDPDGCPLLP